MQRAHEIDAISTQRFWFRKSLAPTQCSDRSRGGSLSAIAAGLGDIDSEIASGGGRSTASSNADTMPHQSPLQKTSSFTLLAASANESETYEEMTLDEILNGTGKEEYYPGLIPLVYAYLEYINCDEETLSKISKYLEFISKRARGELITPATFIRNFVRGHSDYKGDSVISSEIAYDLMMACKGIGEGEIRCPELLGDITIDRVRPEDAYGHVLAGRLSPHERSALLQKLVERAYKPIPRGVARGSSSHY
jgi:glutamate--cysteine ligase catalytic subunit